jgi:hypothetical protein
VSFVVGRCIGEVEGFEIVGPVGSLQSPLGIRAVRSTAALDSGYRANAIERVHVPSTGCQCRRFVLWPELVRVRSAVELRVLAIGRSNDGPRHTRGAAAHVTTSNCHATHDNKHRLEQQHCATVNSQAIIIRHIAEFLNV